MARMEYFREPTPTIYNGVKYRAQLEARWAAFFDIIGWGHQYEPLRLNYYIPDFILTVGSKQLLAEVKPFKTADEWHHWECNGKVTDVIDYVTKGISGTGWEYTPVLLLPANPFNSGPNIGYGLYATMSPDPVPVYIGHGPDKMELAGAFPNVSAFGLAMIGARWNEAYNMVKDGGETHGQPSI